jgi:hypothetical protein
MRADCYESEPGPSCILASSYRRGHEALFLSPSLLCCDTAGDPQLAYMDFPDNQNYEPNNLLSFINHPVSSILL